MICSEAKTPSRRAFSPEAVFPKSPVTATRSPGLAPLRLTKTCLSQVPRSEQLMTRSDASFVSPPMMYASYSRTPSFKPRPICLTSSSVKLPGKPRATNRTSGLTPLAAKSLMFITTALRAACLRLMPGGTSVFPTSMSVFMTASVSASRFTADTSSPNETGMSGIVAKHSMMISITFFSPSSLIVLIRSPSFD